MNRVGCVLLFVAVPVLATAGFYLAAPSDSGTSASSRSPETRAEAKAKAEASEDDEVIADLPPGLAAPAKKDLAQKLIAGAESSTLDWRSTYGSIEDSGDGDGYCAGTIGFCSGTHDMLILVEHYTKEHPDNGLASYLPALREVDGSDSHEGLDPGFVAAWRTEARLPEFREAQDTERDGAYFDPAVRLAKLDGLGTLGQFVYYDAMVHHGPSSDTDGFYGMRERAMEKARTPSDGGSEKEYLTAFLDVRRAEMLRKRPGTDTSRIDTEQRAFLEAGNLTLRTPLEWETYGESYRVP